MSEINETNLEGQPTQKTVFEIFITRDGLIGWSSTITDEIAILGLIEKAKSDIQKKFRDAEIKLHKADHNILNFIRNGKK